MRRSKNSWKLLVLVALLSCFVLCTEVCADNCVKEVKAAQTEQIEEMKAEMKAEIEAKQLEIMDTDDDGYISEEERESYKQKSKEGKEKSPHVPKVDQGVE